ncbi:MAG: RNase adapter RapZ [Acidobacteriota bacterium]|nr:RNase adapter RapZ [Blastocatellia bacterium]MDW8413597.1 RNase adapter RapZ [Acidobacteriota bacterium]
MLELVVITGMSGSGKKTAVNAFEDGGYFCVDNLPVTLIPKFVELCKKAGYEKTVLVIDARERSFLTDCPQVLNQLRTNDEVSLRVIFLEASEEVILRRFSETRRPHPLEEVRSTLLEAIRAERELLEPIKALADTIVDTSEHTVHTLRRYFVEQFSTSRAREVAITVMSFGFKYGIPSVADTVFDLRCLPNPHFVPQLRPLTGIDDAVVEYFRQREEVTAVTEKLCSLLDYLLPLYRQEGKSYLTVAVGCTGGRHRSVYIAERLAEHLNRSGCDVRLRHRDIARD